MTNTYLTLPIKIVKASCSFSNQINIDVDMISVMAFTCGIDGRAGQSHVSFHTWQGQITFSLHKICMVLRTRVGSVNKTHKSQIPHALPDSHCDCVRA